MNLRKYCLIFLCLAASVVAQAQVKTYLALGDSLAWGYQPNDTARGPGDKGYVKVVADYLGSVQGSRPRLKNLGIPGETSGSFFDTSEIGYLLNSNYPLFGRQSQRNQFVSTVAQEQGAGRIITHVSFELGGNDMLDLLTNQFLALSFAQQVAIVDQVLVSVDANVTQAMTIVRQQLPNAIFLVPGYYNPYGAYPGTPIEKIGNYALPKLNLLLRTRAKQFNGLFAETYNGFVGRELQLTWIGENDIHPRTPGYAEYGRRIVKLLGLKQIPTP